MLVVGNVHYYFVEFTPLRRYGSANGETATMIGHYVRDLDGEYAATSRVYFFGPPRLYWGFGTQAFLAPDVAGEDVVEPLTGPPDFVDRDRGAIFVFLPERVGELAWVRQAFPEGELREFYDSQGQLRFTAYTVP